MQNYFVTLVVGKLCFKIEFFQKKKKSIAIVIFTTFLSENKTVTTNGVIHVLSDSSDSDKAENEEHVKSNYI